MGKVSRQYGVWPSRLSAADVAGASVRLSGLASTPAGAIWVEQRPSERGRCVIVGTYAGGMVRDLLPPPYSARSRVHEYGGGAVLAAGEHVFFVNDDDQDLYRLVPGGEPQRLTIMPHTRFADCDLDAARHRLVCVAERHDCSHPDGLPLNFLATMRLDRTPSATVARLVRGADFYAAPRVSPDGRWLAFLSWNLPHMPWEAAALHVAPLGDDGTAREPVHIAGGRHGAAFQPEWRGDGTLLFVLERDEWSNLFAWRDGTVTQLSHFEGELLRPLWALGTRSFAPLADGRVAALVLRRGEDRLVTINPASGEEREYESPHRQMSDPARCQTGACLYALAFNDAQAPAIVELSIDGPPASRLLRRAGGLDIDTVNLSRGVTLKLERSSGAPVYAVHYPPHSDRYCGAPGDLPPLVVMAHGGPTGSADRGLKLKTQFWTSRGFAVLDVDYRGSAGYGRSYRTALDGHWGVRDAEDVCDAARAMVARGLADSERLIVTGGSAGGYTALMALIGCGLFKAAAVSYGWRTWRPCWRPPTSLNRAISTA